MVLQRHVVPGDGPQLQGVPGKHQLQAAEDLVRVEEYLLKRDAQPVQELGRHRGDLIHKEHTPFRLQLLELVAHGLRPHLAQIPDFVRNTAGEEGVQRLAAHAQPVGAKMTAC